MEIRFFQGKLGEEEYLTSVDSGQFVHQIPHKGELVGLLDDEDKLTVVYDVINTLYDYADDEINVFVKEHDWE